MTVHLELTDEEITSLKVILIQQGKTGKEMMIYLDKKKDGEQLDYIDQHFQTLEGIYSKINRAVEEYDNS